MKRLHNIAFLLVLTAQFAIAEQPAFSITVAKPSALPGDYVLCPSRQFYDGAVKNGTEKATFIYYAATMVAANNSG